MAEVIPSDPTLVRGALAKALAAAQSAFPTIPRDKEVTVKTKTGGEYKFKYAPLDSILNAVRKPLAENGLAITQTFDDGELVTSLLHKDGGAMSGRIALPSTGDSVQALGSAITYLRRYSIQAILGIAAEEDDDGNTAAGNTFDRTDAAPKAEPDMETEELAGDAKRTGMVRIGDGSSNKLEARQGPDGYVIGFRLETDKGAIPQVIVAGPAGDALMMATSGNPGAMRDTRATVSGRLFNVKRPGRRSYFRLKVTSWEWGDYAFPADDPELPQPPDDVPLVGEAPPLGLVK